MEPNLRFYEELKGIFNRREIFEILSVYHKIKRCCRLNVSNNNLKKLKELCKKNYLFLEIQDYKAISFPSQGTKFSAISRIVPIGSSLDNFSEFFIYISYSQEIAALAKKFEKNKDSKNLGKVLGYPDCCINYYLANEKKLDQNKIEDLMITADINQHYPFVNNSFLKYFDITLLSHYVCSLNCKESKAIGESFLDLIKRYDLDLASYYEKNLKCFVLYTKSEGVFFCQDYTFKNNKIQCRSKINNTKDNLIFKLLKKNNQIEYISPTEFKINNQLFNNNVFIALFK